MRLIHVESYKIVEFFGENIPVYAILSHTWQDDEVSFSDMQDWLPNDNFVADQPGLRRLSPTVRSKKGFRKIEYTCRQARNHNLGWAWVDTCCIDKTSSSELTEAINSMFQWYQKAARCYAYLADVLNLDRAPKKQLEQRIMASRWFTRGWTLQELIAPKNMTFYSQEWEYLCERVELDNVIAKTTSIPTELMQFGAARSSGPGLQAYSVAQRMSWAANRRCTRLEDTAYSLLGIFDINMPLLYGEGNNAFLRLQEEIFRSTDDHSLLAWTVPLGMPEDEYGRPVGSYDRSNFSFKVPVQSRVAWNQSSILAESPSNFVNSKRIVFLHEELDRPSQITKKGLEMSLLLEAVLPPNNLASLYKKYSPWPVFHAILNCGLEEPDGTIWRAVLPVVEATGSGSSVAPLHCYARLLTTQLIFVPDSMHFSEQNSTSSAYRTVFLRTHRHMLNSNDLLRTWVGQNLEHINVYIHGLPVQRSNPGILLVKKAADQLQAGYFIEQMHYHTDGIAPHKEFSWQSEEWAKDKIATSGSQFQLKIIVRHTVHNHRLAVECGYQRPRHDESPFIQMVFRYGVLPNEVVQLRHRANVETARGTMAQLSFVFYGTLITLDMRCDHTWDRGEPITAKLGERMHIHIHLGCRRETRYRWSYIGKSLGEIQVLPWHVKRFRDFYVISEFYKTQEAERNAYVAKWPEPDPQQLRLTGHRDLFETRRPKRR